MSYWGYIYTKKESIKGKLEVMTAFGLTEGWSFEGFLNRWKISGLAETAKDAYYATKYIRKIKKIDEFPDRDVCGLVFSKQYNGVGTN